MKQNATYLFLLAGFLTFWIPAQSQMVYDTLQLIELQIIESKSEYSSTTKKQTVDSIFKQQTDLSDLGELLSAYTPVFIRSYGKGTLSTASFRGTGAAHTQLWWNDFRLNSPMLGQSDYSLIPVSLFDRIELYYGGASLLNGEGGFGGGINLVSTGDQEPRPIVYLNQALGSFKTLSTAAGLNLETGKFTSDTRIIYQSSKNDFTYYNDAVIPGKEMKQQNADYRNTGFTQQFNYRLSDNHVLTFSTWNQWNNRNIPPIMTNYNQADQMKENSISFFSRNLLGWSFNKNKTKAEVKAAYFFEDYQYNREVITGSEGVFEPLVNSTNQTTGIFFIAKLEQDLGRGFLMTVRLNTDIDRVNSNNYKTRAERTTFGLSAQMEKLFFDRLKISLLLRGQMTDRELLPPMPLMGLNMRILKNQDLYFRASISRNYHLPTLNDLYWNPGGNPALQPEDGFEAEGGFNYTRLITPTFFIKADITAFASKVNQWIIWIDSGNGYWQPENIRKVFARGLEAFLQLKWNVGYSEYILFTQYAHTRTTDETSGIGEQLIYIPRHTANATFQWLYRGFSIAWKGHFVGEQYTVGSTLPGFLINDLSLGKLFRLRSSKLALCFSIHNIFDEDYQVVQWRPMPGRNYEFKLLYQLNHQ